MKRLFFVLALLLPTACFARVPDQIGHTDTAEFMFNTLDSSGAPVTLGGTSPAIVVYEEGSTTPISGGATLTIDYNSTTGLHHVQLVCTTANGYDVNKFYTVVIGGTTATADSVNVKGRELGTFQCVAMVTVGSDNLLQTNVKKVNDTTQTAGDIPALVTTVDTVADGIKTKTDYLPSATAGAAGGVFIAGINAATTITSSTGSALTLNSTGGNGHGLRVVGNGTGEGISAVGGATGNGFDIVGGSTSGNGLYVNTTDGDAFQLNAQGSGSTALVLSGSATGKGIDATGDIGAEFNGTAYGLQLSGPGNAGLNVSGGFDVAGGLSVAGGASIANSAGTALTLTSSGSNGNGMLLTGHGSGSGLYVDGGASAGDGITVTSTGVGFSLTSTGDGIEIGSGANGIDVGGTTSGLAITNGASITNSGGTALTLTSSGGNGHGLAATGNGTGSGFEVTAGATGTGIAAVGGSTSGTGFYVEATSGYAAQFTTAGGSAAGLSLSGGNGYGLALNGSAGDLWSENNAAGYQDLSAAIEDIEIDAAAVLVDTGTTIPATLASLDSGYVRSTTVATVTSQTQLILTAGPDFDDALNNQVVVLTDATNNDYESMRVITDYAGSTKTATLNAAADFTVAAADGVKIYPTSPYVDASVASITSGTGYSKDNVDSSRVWTFPKNWKSSKSPVTIVENASFNGTLKFDLRNRVNEGAGALTITSVTCDPSDGITLGTPVKTSDNMGVMVSASGFESGVTYTFTVTHSTTDSDTALVSTGDFKAE